MRKSLIPLIILLLLMISNNTFAQTFSGGSGTAVNPYRISNVSDLNDIAYYVNSTNWRQNSFNGKYFVMTANITV
ncbi:MAG TPA: hypothetical protein DD434_14075, partial [Bacteroidales bacterium]|nr:hypothetical protein [Bacteroidales bacterium]